MNNSDNKWIDKIRDELINYHPECNATDWNTLKKSLPANTIRHKLSKFVINWIKSLLFIIIPATTIFVIYLYKNDTNISQHKTTPISKNIKKNNKIIKQSKVYISKEKSKTEIKKNSNETFTYSTNSKQLKKKIKEKTNSKNINKNKKLIKHAIFANKITKKSNNLPQSINPDLKKNTIKQITTNNYTKQVQSENITINKMIPIIGTLKAVKQNYSKEPIGFDNSEKIKLQNDTNSLFIYTKDTIKNKLKENNSTAKSANKKQLPFLIGPMASFKYITNINPKYESKINFSGGLTFEKFITQNSSISIKPQFLIDKFKYTKINPNDSTTISHPINSGDSTIIQNDKQSINHQIEETSTLELFYFDFPVIFNYYIIEQKQNRLALSAGISNKYIFSIKENNKHLTNKFYLSQAVTFGIIYNRKSNENLFFNIEPFVTIPIRKIKPENYSWISFGININILFKINRKNRDIKIK